MPHQQIVCLGLSHRTAPVDVREQLRCSLLDVGQMLPAFEADHLENDALTRLSDETVPQAGKAGPNLRPYANWSSCLPATGWNYTPCYPAR